MLWWKYQQLRMGNVKSRLAVVEELAMAGNDDAVGPLIFALKDRDVGVRCAAAKALMRFHDRRAIEPMIRMLRDKEPLARAAAAEALGQFGDPGAVNPLVGLLRDADPIVRTVTARSLNRLGWKPGTDSQRALQILAMGNLDKLAALGPEGVTPLLDLLQNGPPNKQFSALKALADMNDPRVRPALIEALQKTSPAVRIAALGALERLADPAAFGDIEKALKDTNASVRGAAVEAAVRCAGARAVPALIQCLDDESWDVRQAAANALGSLGEQSAVPALCARLNDTDRDVRERIIAALGLLGDRRAIAPLVLATLDPESTVRNAASATLLRLDRRWHQNEAVREVMPKIKEALDHDDYWVRHSAGQLLERFKSKPAGVGEVRFPSPESGPAASKPAREAAPDPGLRLLSDLLFDHDRAMRLAAVAVLGRLRDPNARSLLATAVHDDDSLVQETARQALAGAA
jgi:HEAT repeat protein